MALTLEQKKPRRWSRGESHGCYFPETDLNVADMGGRSTGVPRDVEWIDPVDDLPWVQPKASG